MKQPMVVTNIRLPEAEYRQIKSQAAELGMSVNQYFTQLAKDNTRRRMFKTDAPKRKIKKETIMEAFARIAKMPNKPMGASEEDEAIYFV